MRGPGVLLPCLAEGVTASAEFHEQVALQGCKVVPGQGDIRVLPFDGQPAFHPRERLGHLALGPQHLRQRQGVQGCQPGRLAEGQVCGDVPPLRVDSPQDVGPLPPCRVPMILQS